MNRMSDGNGPLASIPISLAFSMAGALHQSLPGRTFRPRRSEDSGLQGKPGLLNTGILKGNIGQSYGSHDGIHGQAVADIANGNMAGCPCGPQISQHIVSPNGSVCPKRWAM